MRAAVLFLCCLSLASEFAVAMLVALISVISAVGPRMISWLTPLGSILEIKEYNYSTNAITLFVENKGNRPGLIGRVNVLIYCFGADFNQNDRVKYGPNADRSTLPPVWGVNIDLGTSPNMNRTVPARSSREISFLLSQKTLRKAAEDFDKDLRYPLGTFNTVLYNESVRIHVSAELWDYGQQFRKVVTVTPKPDPPFWRGFTTITQEM